MAINIQIIKKTQPGITGGGNVMYYAQAGRRGKRTIDDVCHYLEKSSSLTAGDIMSVLTGLSNLIPEFLMQGYTVELDRLGTFSLHVRSEGHPDPDKIDTRNIKEARIHFRPGVLLKKQLTSAKYKIIRRKR